MNLNQHWKGICLANLFCHGFTLSFSSRFLSTSFRKCNECFETCCSFLSISTKFWQLLRQRRRIKNHSLPPPVKLSTIVLPERDLLYEKTDRHLFSRRIEGNSYDSSRKRGEKRTMEEEKWGIEREKGEQIYLRTSRQTGRFDKLSFRPV